MDVRDEFGKWVLGEVTPVEMMKNKVHVHFVGWDTKWDLILHKVNDKDRFAQPGQFSSNLDVCEEFKPSQNVVILRRKPNEARGKWIPGFVRVVDGPQIQVQYSYRGITFQYWYHYHQAEVHPQEDYERWINIESVDDMKDLPDGESGPFGKEVMDLLFSRKAKPLKRVGAHADGTCFFHAVFHSLDAKHPFIKMPKYAVASAAAPPAIGTAAAKNRLQGSSSSSSSSSSSGSSSKGVMGEKRREEEKKFGTSEEEISTLSYRQLTPNQRLIKGKEWRKVLRECVKEEWFRKNLGNVCDFEEYLQQYQNVKFSAGPTHNMHVAAFFEVNIFFVSFYTHPETKQRDFFVRISSPDGAAQYNSTKPSIILFHRAVGNTGHYESIQTDEPGEKFGRGIFVHNDSIIQHLLSKANTLL